MNWIRYTEETRNIGRRFFLPFIASDEHHEEEQTTGAFVSPEGNGSVEQTTPT